MSDGLCNIMFSKGECSGSCLILCPYLFSSLLFSSLLSGSNERDKEGVCYETSLKV